MIGDNIKVHTKILWEGGFLNSLSYYYRKLLGEMKKMKSWLAVLKIMFLKTYEKMEIIRENRKYKI